MNVAVSGKWHQQGWPQWLVDIFALIFPSLLLTVNRADSVSLACLLIAGIYIGVRHGFLRGFDRQEKILCGAFAGMFVVVAVCYLLGEHTDAGFRMAGRNLRLLLFIPAYLVFRYRTPRGMFVYIGMVIGAIVCATYALVTGLFDGSITRVVGVTGDAIGFGDMALVIGFWSLSPVLAAVCRSSRKRLYWLAALGILCGLLASFLSGSRGGWLAIPILVVVSVVVLAEKSRRTLWRGLIGFIILAILAAAVVPRQLVHDRIVGSIKETSLFFHYHARHDKMGVRTGCDNGAHLLNGLIRSMYEDGYVGALNVTVTNDPSLQGDKSTPVRCETDSVIHAVNPFVSQEAALTVPRSVLDAGGEQTISVLARGQGQLKLNGGTGKTVSFDVQRYTDISLTDRMTLDAPPYLIISISPGKQLDFVPLALAPNEYAWFYAASNIGQRLEMWRTAWDIFLDHPVLGAGTGAFMKQAYGYAERGTAAPQVAAYDHPHNDFLNVLYGEGLLGLAAFLLLLGWPGYLYLDALRNSPAPTARAAAFCGLILIAGLVVFGLTESMFVHSLVLGWYAIMTAMLCALLRASPESPRADPRVLP